VFAADAKDPTAPFDRRVRAMDALLLESTMRRELAHARDGVERRVAVLPLPERLSRPLVGERPLVLRGGVKPCAMPVIPP
jgi:hypothetical protein